MSFTSPEFLVFLSLCIGLVWVTRSVPAKKWLLIVLSYLFLYTVSGLTGAALITILAVVDFNVGLRVQLSATVACRKRWLLVSLTANLGALLFFKYAVFLAETATFPLHLIGVPLPTVQMGFLLPVGISYFTFAGLSYALDVYYERIQPSRSISDYICYLVYFPKLLAGPIVRAAEFLPQIGQGFRISAADIETGCAYLLIGACKKLIIADRLGSHVGMIFAAPGHYDAFTLLQGMVGYTVQIYADFSGYSDMAIGAARLMGIRFPQNFLTPYSAVNITDFWRRWHVTLSSWFRDYVFIPLELGSRGAKNATARVCRNVLITMLLCGMWHGAKWNFVFWGALHGMALAAHRIWGTWFGTGTRGPNWAVCLLGSVSSRLLTIAVVMTGWVLFGTDDMSQALVYLRRLLTWSTDGVALGSPYILPVTSLVILAHLFLDKDRNIAEELVAWSMPKRVFSYTTLLVALTSLVPSDSIPFVYVQF